MNINYALIGIWVLRILAALIMLQTLYFKFSASPESVYIFSRVGMEPWGRIATGILELIASILILYPRTTYVGAILALFIMAGAIWFHFTKLGISVMNDKGQLFIYALLVLISSLLLLIINRQNLFQLFKKIFG